MKLEAFFEKFDLFADAPDAVAKMRGLVLDLAVRGGLVAQDASDEPARELLESARAERAKLVAARKIKAREVYPVETDEQPFELPSSWAWARLAEVGYELGQKSPDQRFTYIDVGSIDSSRGRISDRVERLEPAEAPSRARKLVDRGTVIYSMVRPYLLNVAIVEQVYDPEPIASTAFGILQPFTGINNRYLFYWLRSAPFTQYVQEGMKGMAYPAINDEKFYSGVIPLPPLAEQKRIVAKLDELMVLCDRLEAQQQERETRHAALARAVLSRFAEAPTPANLNVIFHRSYDIAPADLRKTILMLAVQGKLVGQVPGEEPVDGVLEEMQKRRHQLIGAKKIRKPQELPPVTEEEIPFAVPDIWRWRRWGQICDWITYGFTRPMSHVDYGPPIVTAKNVQDGFMTFENTHRAEIGEFTALNPKDLPRKGDILITKDGTIGRAAIVETDEVFCINQSVAVLWLESCLLYRPFMLLVIRSPFAQGPIWEASEGMAIKHLSITDFGRMILPIPPLTEQKRIVAKVSELMALVDQLEAQLATARTTATKLLDALVTELTAKA